MDESTTSSINDTMDSSGMDETLGSDDTATSIDESINIDTTFEGSVIENADGSVIENSDVSVTENSDGSEGTENSINNSAVSDNNANESIQEESDEDLRKSSEPFDSRKESKKSEVNTNGDKSTMSFKVKEETSKASATPEANISDSESDHEKPFSSSEVHNMSAKDSELNKSAAIYIIDSSDESSVFEVSEPVAKIKTEMKLERGVKFETGVKLEPNFNFQTDVKPGPSMQSLTPSKLNPLQLVDDIKPIHTGKTGMETFNNQQSMALTCMKNLCASLDVKPHENEMAENPKELKVELMPHQRSALTWMLWRENQRPKGGILADDMGLGKTMSMISLIVKKRFSEEAESSTQSSDSSDDDDDDAANNKSSWIAKGASSKSYYFGGTLVVCPASIMEQWKAEVKNRVKSNTLTVVLHHGSNRETRPKSLSKHDIVITTYGIVSSECDNHGALFSVKWERIILDEAHVIRNHNSKQSISCCKLKASARWTLTGTPIQNKEADLYPLLKFLRCRPFDDYSSFKMWISKSSSKSQERLNQVLQALLLRRTKEDLKEIGQIESLPEKRKEIVDVKLTTDEMNVYQKVMIYSQTLFSQYLHQRETRNNFSIETNSEQKNQWVQLHQKVSKVHGSEAISGHHILILILRLRQICIHPSLIHAMLLDGELDGGDSDTENTPEVDLLEQLSKLQIDSNEEDNDTVSKASSKVLLKTNPVFDESRISSKFQKIIEYITEKLIASGDKGIVVSQFATVLNMLGRHLKNLGIKFVMLTGQTKIDSRNEIVTNFNSSNSSVQVMLLSLTAGGVGLNLVGANHLFFVDPHWNPQLENQAQDRIYRLGQKKPVTIYKFLCDDTIERRIQHLQENKLEIANQVLTGAKRTSTKLTLQDMKSLFEL